MIKEGDRVFIKPEWQDKGDAELEWRAIENEDGGRVKISPVMPNLPLPPVYVVRTDWLVTSSN